MLKKTLKTLGLIILLIVLFILGFFWKDANFNKYDNFITKDKVPVFNEVELGFNHKYNNVKSLPIAPSALIDINNDNVDEVFFGGGMNQDDALFAFKNGKFIDISTDVNLPKKGNDVTSVGVVSADFDNNGFTDLLISRENGLVIYYNSNGKFSLKEIKTPINEKSTPAGITVGDIDKDGDLDIFLATYIKKELMEGQTIFEDYNYGSTSELLLNTGNENFVSITKQAGLDYVHNTFQGVFVDIDNNGWLDLVVAHDTGEVRTYKNNGDLTYSLKENPLTKKFAYPMGIAVGDYNNDGLVDFMFSNTGSTLPRFVAKGDIKDASKFNEKWILFKNEGNFKFTDVAEKAKIANYEFSWGTLFADLNNDGLQDLIVAENYVDLAPNKLFRLPSRVLIQKEDHTFSATEKESNLVNPHFAITPLISDFNKDGYLDLIWTNINSPSLAYINNGGKNNFIQIDLGESYAVHGTTVSVKTPTKKLSEYLVTGEGLASDQTSLLHFGLGEENKVLEVSMSLSNGKKISIINPKINSILNLKPTVKKLVTEFNNEQKENNLIQKNN
ncbi:CRTAC1 family protein [Tenacibaculum sp. M341]|uniref:CRTAC1 family protein n=1 Tax=Tenacibaculum sp. M341 TaxID=2530339 RepID=UPI00104D06D6|nr:CRTAC1 family protein [Tenacibaculum sp. M341]TCI90126.1 CRTAC1 family protein [Tenacibaculum sp. M341]